MSAIDDLIAVARAYAESEDIDISTVSWRSMGDTKKLDAMLAGSDIQVRRFEKTMQWFADHWPAAAVWPADVLRPSPSTQPAEQGDDQQHQHADGGASADDVQAHEVTS